MLTGSFNVVRGPYKYASNGYHTLICRKINGDEATISTATSVDYSVLTNANVQLGSDGTPESEDDYKLGSIINNLTTVSAGTDVSKSASKVDRYDDHQYKYHFITASRTVRNDTNSNITICEVAIYTNLSSDVTIMLSRNIIDPVVIAPGKTFTFSVTIGDDMES